MSKLLCLSLERTPAAEMIAGTAAMWVEVAEVRRAWDEERDRLRVRSAFVQLAASRRLWPAPIDFLEAVAAQPFPKLAALPSPPADPERAMAAIREAQEMLNAGRDVPEPVAVRVARLSREELEAAERDLAQRAQDRKTAAAGGDA